MDVYATKLIKNVFTLISALFRLAEPSGQVQSDGLDIKQLGLSRIGKNSLQPVPVYIPHVHVNGSMALSLCPDPHMHPPEKGNFLVVLIISMFGK